MAVKFRGNTWTNWHRPEALMPEDFERVILLIETWEGQRCITTGFYDSDICDWIPIPASSNVIAWCRLPDLPKESDL